MTIKAKHKSLSLGEVSFNIKAPANKPNEMNMVNSYA